MLKKQRKIQKNILLREDVVQKLVDLAAEKNLTFGGVVEYLVVVHEEHRSTENEKLLATMDTMIKKNLQELLMDDVKRIRITANVVDRSTQMMLEFWNHYFIVTDAKTLGSTQRYKTIPFEEAEVLVKERIAHNRQKKLDAEVRKMK